MAYDRLLAVDLARPQVIQDYVTPPNNTLSRHLMTHLSPQINHLVSARPMSVTMGNAIRQLKLDISKSDIDLPEQDVSQICELLRRAGIIDPCVIRQRMQSASKSIITFGIRLSLPVR